MVIHQFYYDVAPMELNKLCKEKFYFDVALMELNKLSKEKLYYDIAPMEHIFCNENQIDQIVYELYELTEEEIKIVESH